MSDAVGRSSWKNCKLKRSAVDVWRGVDLPNRVTFADGRGRIRAFHAFQRVGVDGGLRRTRIQEGDIIELHGNGAAMDLDFGGEGRVVHRYYTCNKARPSIGEQRRVLTRVGGGHHHEGIAAVVRWHVWQSRGIPTVRWLLTCLVDTVAVA